MKKLLVSALVAAMVLGFGSMAMGAAGDIANAPFSDIAGHEAEGELTYFFATGVFAGEGDGTVKPDDPLTRAAFCKVVVESFGKGNMAAALAGLRPNFVDEVPAWAWGYVNVATYMGVINGYEDGTFKAGNYVTYGEAITMLIRALPGHKDQVGAGVWPYNYIFYGVDNKFNGPVDVSFASLPCTRGDMARMLFATLAYVPKLVAGTGGVMIEDKTMLEDVLCTEVVTNFATGSVWLDGVESALADPVYVVGADSYAGLLGSTVIAVVDSLGKVFFMMTTDAADTFTGVFDEYKIIDNVYYLIFDDGTKIKFDGHWLLDVTLNQEPGYDEEALSAGDECIVTMDANGKAINATAFRYDLAETWITAHDKAGPDTDLADITLNVGGNLPLPATARILVNGAAVSADDLKVDDVVKVARYGTTGSVIAVSAIRTVVEGKVTTTRVVHPGGKNYATINDTEYLVTSSTIPNKDDIVKYGLDHAGTLFHSLGYTTEYPYVLVKGYTTGSAGDFVTVDFRGTDVTYKTTVDFYSLGYVGDYGELAIDTSTNTVTGFTLHEIDSVVGADFTYKVVAISGTKVTLEAFYNGVSVDYFYFLDFAELALYKNVSGAKTWLGAEALSVGMFLDADDDVFVFFQYTPAT